MHPTLRRSHRLAKGGMPILLLVGLIVSGCGSFRLQQPQNQELAQIAYTHFRNAALSQTIAAERERLATVLEQELDLVARHTLARRDARLLFLINAGADSVLTPAGMLSPWQWLKQDIEQRIGELGFDSTAFVKTVRALALREDRLSDLEAVAGEWQLASINDPSLPFLSCWPDANLASDPSWSPIVEDVFERYDEACTAYLEVTTVTLGNEDLIRHLKDAQAGADRLIGEQANEFARARDSLFAAQATRESSEIADKATEFRNKAAAFGALPSTFKEKLRLDQLESRLGPLGLTSIIDDLESEAVVAHLKAERAEVLSALDAIVNAGSTLAPDARPPESALEVVSLLATAGKAVERAQSPVTLSDLQIQAEQLRLNIVAAEQRKAFFDEALVLLEQDQEARIQEIVYLNRAYQFIPGVIGEQGCLQGRAQPIREVARVFEAEAGVDERCREKVFKLLVAYSNAWTFGRVPQEQNYYRLIALHHEASLGQSEVALARWENVLGVPINQLAALYGSGTHPADVVSLVSSIASTVGLGIIALGVNK